MRPAQVLEAALRIRPGEIRRTLLLFLYLTALSCCFVAGRTVRDTLFLKRFGLTYLPLMFIGYGLTAAVVAAGYGRIADRIRKDRLILGHLAIIGVTYGAAYALVRAEWRPVYPVFYIWVEVASNLTFIQFWTLANDLHDAREAKRLFSSIGAGRVLGIVVMGFGIGVLKPLVGPTENLIFVILALYASAAGLAIALRRYPSKGGPAPRRRKGQEGAEGSLLGSPYLQIIAGMVLATFVAATLVDYQFKAIARATFDENGLARFFGTFYGVVGIVGFVFQFFLTSRIQQRLGVLAALLVMPVAIFTGSVALLAVPAGMAVWAVTVAKFGDNAFQFTINDSTFQLLYFPIPAAVQGRVRALIEGAIKPIGYGAGGAILWFAASPENVVLLSWGVLGFIALWVGLAAAARTGYVAALQRTLKDRRRPATSREELVADRASLHTIDDAIAHGSSSQVLFALELLSEFRTRDLVPELLALLAHESPLVRARAALMLAPLAREHADPHLRDALVKLVADPEPEVRAAAIRAALEAAGDDAAERAEPFLASGNLRERASAIAGLLRHGGLDGVVVAAAPFKEMVRSRSPEERRAAADVLREVADPDFVRPISDLLHDVDPRVRRAAAAAAGAVGSARLVEPLTNLLADPLSAGDAARALGKMGPLVVPRLGAVLDDPGASREQRHQALRALRECPGPEALAVLARLADAPDPLLRGKAVKAVAKRARDGEAPPWSPPTVDARARIELAEHTQLAGAARAIRDPLLKDALDERARGALARMFRTLELVYPPRTMSLCRYALVYGVGGHGSRANAMEVLDNVLDRRLGRAILAGLEEAERAEGAATRLEDVMEKAAAQGDTWVRDCAKRALGKLEGTEMAVLDRVMLLKGVELFARVPGEDLSELARVAEEVEVPAGGKVFSEGEPGDALFLVLEGKVRIHIGERLLAELGALQPFGEMAILDGEPRSASATAAVDAPVRVLKIDREDFYEILSERIEIAQEIFKVLTARLRAADRKLADAA